MGPIARRNGFGDRDDGYAVLPARLAWARGCVAVCAALGGFMMLPKLRAADAAASQKGKGFLITSTTVKQVGLCRARGGERRP